MIVTDCFFNEFFYFLKVITQDVRFDYISFCITAAYVFLCFCTLIVNLIKPQWAFSRLKKVIYCIIWCVAADLAVCLTECEYVGVRFSSVLLVVAFVCFKFCFMFIVYGCVHFLSFVKLKIYKRQIALQKNTVKGVFNQEKDCMLSKNCKNTYSADLSLKADICNPSIKNNESIKNVRLTEEVCDETENKLSLQVLDKICSTNKPVVDVNFAYLRQTVKALKSKNLSDEDRRFADDLELLLKNKISYEQKDVEKLNDYLRVLVKKAVAYGVNV